MLQVRKRVPSSPVTFRGAVGSPRDARCLAVIGCGEVHHPFYNQLIGLLYPGGELVLSMAEAKNAKLMMWGQAG